jgi:hypothetical protein
VREQQLKSLKKKAKQLGVNIFEPGPRQAKAEAVKSE